MARQQQVRKTKRNGNAVRTQSTVKRVSKRAPPAKMATAPPPSSTNKVPALNVTHLRFHFASLLRLSDNLVAKAVGAYDRLFALDQRDEAEIYLQMGRELASEDKLDEALEALRKVPQTHRDHGEALYELGVIHLRRGATHAAAEMLQKAKLAGKRGPRLHQHLAEALSRENKFDAALSELEAAVELNPGDADSHYRRAILLDRVERYLEAVEAFEAAIALTPDEVRYHQSLGFTLETLGRRADAIKCFKRALELERSVAYPADVVNQ